MVYFGNYSLLWLTTEKGGAQSLAFNNSQKKICLRFLSVLCGLEFIPY